MCSGKIIFLWDNSVFDSGDAGAILESSPEQVRCMMEVTPLTGASEVHDGGHTPYRSR